MLVHVFSCLIFSTQPYYNNATRWQYRACVTSRHSGLQRTSVSMALEPSLSCLRLFLCHPYVQFEEFFYFAVGGEHIAVVMVVVGHICTQNIIVVHNTVLAAIYVAMATCNLAGKMLLTNYSFILHSM